MLWIKPGAGTNEFSRDRYNCLQQSQQRTSSAYVNQFGGGSNSQMETNDHLYAACMNSNGWYLQTQPRTALTPSATEAPAPVLNNAPRTAIQSNEEKLRDAAGRLAAAGRAMCQSTEYALIYAKTPCQTGSLTAAHLSDTSRVTDAENKQLVEHQKARAALDQKASQDLYLYGGARGSALKKAFDERTARIAVATSRLMQGGSTWGEFNRTRQQLQEQFDAEAKRISQTRY